MARNGLTRADAERRLAMQPAQAEYERVAGLVLPNDGTQAELEQRVEAAYAALVAHLPAARGGDAAPSQPVPL